LRERELTRRVIDDEVGFGDLAEASFSTPSVE